MLMSVQASRIFSVAVIVRPPRSRLRTTTLTKLTRAVNVALGRSPSDASVAKNRSIRSTLRDWCDLIGDR